MNLEDENMQEYLPLKTKVFQPGQMIGSFEDKQSQAEQNNSALCKSDCILLVLSRRVFDILHKKKDLKRREAMVDFLVLKIPKVLKFYSLFRLVDHVGHVFKDIH